MSQNLVRLCGCAREARDYLLTLNMCKGTERAPRAVASLAHVIAFCRFVDLGNKTKYGSLLIWVSVRRAQLTAQHTPTITDCAGTSSCKTDMQGLQKFMEGLVLNTGRY